MKIKKITGWEFDIDYDDTGYTRFRFIDETGKEHEAMLQIPVTADSVNLLDGEEIKGTGGGLVQRLEDYYMDQFESPSLAAASAAVGEKLVRLVSTGVGCTCRDERFSGISVGFDGYGSGCFVVPSRYSSYYQKPVYEQVRIDDNCTECKEAIKEAAEEAERILVNTMAAAAKDRGLPVTEDELFSPFVVWSAKEWDVKRGAILVATRPRFGYLDIPDYPMRRGAFFAKGYDSDMESVTIIWIPDLKDEKLDDPGINIDWGNPDIVKY